MHKYAATNTPIQPASGSAQMAKGLSSAVSGSIVLGAGLGDASCCKDGATGNVSLGEIEKPVVLTTLLIGQTGVVCETCMDKRDAAMLRAMGLRPQARIRVCRMGEPWIVEVLPGGAGASGVGVGKSKGVVADLSREAACAPAGDMPCARAGGCACRIGLARALAERVLLEPRSIRNG